MSIGCIVIRGRQRADSGSNNRVLLDHGCVKGDSGRRDVHFVDGDDQDLVDRQAARIGAADENRVRRLHREIKDFRRQYLVSIDGKRGIVIVTNTDDERIRV